MNRKALIAIVMAVVAVASAWGQEWLDRANAVSELVRGVTAGEETWVTDADEYDPQRRIIHNERLVDDIDYPVRFTAAQWKDRLSPDRYYVLRQDGTEPAFRNELYDTKGRGIYYSAATGQPLFHSDDKYESGTGWPSFTKPISPDAVAYFWDRSLFSTRIEVVDSLSGSHIGHVFNDGPAPTRQRYCMNSAALIFVPEGEDPPAMLAAAP